MTASDRPIIGAVGAGRMGRGIALAFAYAGHRVTLIDLRARGAEALAALHAEAMREIAADLDFLAGMHILSAAAIDDILGLISFAGQADAPAAIAGCDVLFEGVPETIAAKTECLAFLGQHARPDSIIASTTSTISAETLSLLIAEPGRFLNAHWLNPAHLMALVEISPAASTKAETISKLRALLNAIGKVPVVCNASPGYIIPRIQALAMNEAARMVEEGVATAEDIDSAIRVGFGPRFSVLGLLEFIDWGGCDILSHASGFLSTSLGARFAAPDIIATNMREERKGLRDGRGFYDYADVDVAGYRNQRLKAFVELLELRGLMPVRRA